MANLKNQFSLDCSSLLHRYVKKRKFLAGHPAVILVPIDQGVSLFERTIRELHDPAPVIQKLVGHLLRCSGLINQKVVPRPARSPIASGRALLVADCVPAHPRSSELRGVRAQASFAGRVPSLIAVVQPGLTTVVCAGELVPSLIHPVNAAERADLPIGVMVSQKMGLHGRPSLGGVK